MNLLFVHQGFPGQYWNILSALSGQKGHQIVALGIDQPSRTLPENVSYIRYGLQRGNTTGIHPWVQETESKVIRGEACARAARVLQKKGFQADLICAHPGWGETLFLKEIWPETPLLLYQEFFYNTVGYDHGFDPEFQTVINWESGARTRMKNAFLLLSLESSDWCVSPTEFQKNSFPTEWRRVISTIHDGIDTTRACPSSTPSPVQLPDSTILQAGEPIVTFVNRRLEPYRGFHVFMRAIPLLQEECPEARIVIVGKMTGSSYGAECPEGEWKDRFLEEIEGKYDPSRLHFTDHMAYNDYLSLLKVTAVHAYLTYPFVLSWSLLEAMSSGCPVVGSSTAPVTEVIQDGVNGLLVDFFRPDDLAKAIASLLHDRANARVLGENARKTIIQKYSLERCVPQHLALMQLVANRALKR
jgi:glycosyltransferase involved in cell wall biosynthesis